MSMEADTAEVQLTQIAENSKPKEGLEFSTVDEAFEFYNAYAKIVGFSTRKSTVRRTDEVIKWQKFVCYKEGKHNDCHQKRKASEQNASEGSGTSKVERNRGIVRTGCRARMAITMHKDATHYVLSHFIENHNHALATPRKTHFLNSHRNVTKAKKLLTQHLAQANVPTSQQARIHAIEAGGFQNMGCTERDLRNHLRDQRVEQDGIDAATLFEFFSLQKQNNPSFYFCFDKDKEGRMSRCFWADSVSRLAYTSFGDVVVFDTTYNTNKYNMIFAPILGINHHGKTILFGCGFLSDETTDSFVWFFQQFLQSMLKGPPQLIITDQDPAMTKAIAEVLPETFHRYCIWHIMNKFSDKMGPLNFQKYYKLFQSSVYNSDTIEEFESSWSNALQQSSLHSHAWLCSIYKIRQQWVPAYVNTKVFSAGCMSSQRAESGHSFFKKYVAKEHSLMDFVTRFSLALAYQREEELYEEWKNINERPKLKSVIPMEKQMAEIYTKKIFIDFQKELYQSDAYLHKTTSEANVYVVFRADDDSSKLHRLVYDANTDFLRCSCRLFEFEGFPCRHMLHFIRVSLVMHLPEHYILKRWTRSAKVGGIWDNMSVDVSDVSSKSILQRRALMFQYFSPALEDAILSDKGIEMAKKKCDELTDELKQLNLTHDHFIAPTRRNLFVGVNMSDPKSSRTKGCGSRLKPAKEKAIRKGRLCHGCGMRDQSHDKRNCPALLGRDNESMNDESSNASEQEDISRLNESDSD